MDYRIDVKLKSAQRQAKRRAAHRTLHGLYALTLTARLFKKWAVQGQRYCFICRAVTVMSRRVCHYHVVLRRVASTHPFLPAITSLLGLLRM